MDELVRELRKQNHRLRRERDDARAEAAEQLAERQQVTNQLIRLEERLWAANDRADRANARAIHATEEAVNANARADHANARAIHATEEAVNANARADHATEEVANANTRLDQANTRLDRVLNDTRFFAAYGIQQTERLLTMHERLNTSHSLSIENHPRVRMRPVVTLLDASASDFVRKKRNLPRDRYPRVFKIVEGQEGFHVQNEVAKLQRENCEVLVPAYPYSNGITLRNSIRRRLDAWVAQQLTTAAAVDGVQETEDIVQYFSQGIIAFRENRRGLRNRQITEFFEETIRSLLATPDQDLEPFDNRDFRGRAQVYIEDRHID